ncbi:MAG: hypoxanthine-guanine phosphoribosyltransferase [Gammaproteobacteria bacterium]|nr:hypoxanthine-guanine phosphoribosyltransferase [Gammaproteobacteria bacterium]
MPISPQEAHAVYQDADCLFSQKQVNSALDQMADAISAQLCDKNPLVICVMNGGLIVTGALLQRLDFPLQIDYLHATRYRDNIHGSDIEWRVKPSHTLKDRTLLLIDDILDEGHTLAAVVEACQQAGAKNIHTAVLLEKRHDRKHGINATFCGLEVEDRYVFGYGMDYKGYLRNAPGIFAVKNYV